MKTQTIKALLVAGILGLCASPVLADLWVEPTDAEMPPLYHDDPDAKILGATTDDDGNVFVTGSFRGTMEIGHLRLASRLSTSPDLKNTVVRNLFVAKMDTAGNWLWASQADGDYSFAPYLSDSEGRGIAVLDDGSGDVSVFVTGWFTGTAEFDGISKTARDASNNGSGAYRNVLVAKLDDDGNWLWVTRGAGGDGDHGGSAIAVNAAGEVFVAGTVGSDADLFGDITESGSGCDDALVAGLTAGGQWDWVRKLGTTSNDRGTGIALGSEGDLRVAWTSPTDGWVEKCLAADGRTDDAWNRIQITDAGHLALALDGADNVVLTGRSGTPDALFVGKWDSSGTPKLWDDRLADGTMGWSVALEPEGDVYVAGQNGPHRILVSTWDGGGTPGWTRETHDDFTGTGSGATAVTVGASGTPYVAGFLGSDTTFEASDDSLAITVNGIGAGFAGKLDPSDGRWVSDRCSLHVNLEDESGGQFLLEGDELPRPPAHENPTWFLEGSTVEWEVENQGETQGDTEGPKTPSLGREHSTEIDHFAYGWRLIEECDPEIDEGCIEGWKDLDDGRGNLLQPFDISRNRKLVWEYHPADVHYVGDFLTPPDGTSLATEWDDIIIRDDENASPSRYFVQSIPDARLYGVREVVQAEIRWPLEEPERDDCDISPGAGCDIVELHKFDWPAESDCEVDATPRRCQFHVRYAAFTQDSDNDDYKYEELKFPDGEVSFNPDRLGWSVLHYVNLLGDSSYVPADHPSVIEVVKTVGWEHLAVRLADESPAVGTTILDPVHTAPGTGYVLHLANEVQGLSLFPPYDGVGEDAAYDRESRTGQIVPVNRVIEGIHDELIVAWYQQSTRVPGVYWAGKAGLYDPQWIPDATLDIETGQGSGPLDPLAYANKRIYTQPDPQQPGHDLNDEHALFVSSGGGDELFALRGDLGALAYPGATDLDPIEPFVLLKYRDEANDRWGYRAFEVVVPPSTGIPPGDSITAGNPVLPPYPLSTLSSCEETFAAGTCSDDQSWCNVNSPTGCSGSCDPDEPFWQDYKGGVWARSGPSFDSDGTMRVHYFYPLQSGFWSDADLNDNGSPDEAVGLCVPWLDRLDGGTIGTPVEVEYQVAWPEPSTVATMYVGETLLSARDGLPEITNQPSSEIIYDETDHDDGTGAHLNESQARLIDALSPRAVPLSNALFAAAGLDTDIGDGGRQIILGGSGVKTPPLLRKRLRYDPLATNCVTNTNGTENCIVGELVLEGLFDDTEVGEPLLALNLMSKREYARLRELDDGDGDDIPGAGWPTNDCFPVVDVDDPCTWDEAVEALYHLARNPRRLGGPNAELLIGFQDENDDDTFEPYRAAGVPAALITGAAVLPAARGSADPPLEVGEGFLTLAFNNDPDLSPLPVSVNVIRVACPPYQGEIDVIEPYNIFDELLTLHHSGDFGGDPDNFYFEWWRRDDPDWTCLPDDGECTEWQLHDQGQGLSDVTIEGSDLTTLSDNYYIVRYMGQDGASPPYAACSTEYPTSDWTGGPGSDPGVPDAKLAEGWVKRVVRKLNAFETRVTSFHTTPTNTYSSMLVQLGERYEGDIAFSNDPEYLNSIGLIEAYETVVRRALALNEGLDYEPANRQILLAASRIADFYTLLANEAYADAMDPTIALGTSSELGTLAPAMFAFENQLDTLLEEELTLLRGRDDSLGTPTSAPPVYNRDFWNFTSGDGEVAYVQTYAITDETGDGVIDEADARVLYPQGHGDAWGHYLTAMKSYYRLMRDPDFTWLPRSEQVEVAGADVEVDYLDERKFARTAALKAQAGAELVDLTYRDHYVEDSTGWWQGYKDSEEVQPGVPRAWGFDGWARRAGQGAYFDWAVANAVLPDRVTGTCSLTTGQACEGNLDCPDGTCSVTTAQSCHDSLDCPAGNCNVTIAQSCRGDLDCPAGNCSVTTAQSCRGDLDCPAGNCSVTTDDNCRHDLDCPDGETCENTETCENEETCEDAEICEFPTGIRKIDRTTVPELAEIPGAADAVQARADDADRGLNPLGLARGVVPFDIDPSEIAEGKTHFEQIYDRALDVLEDAVAVYDHANQLGQSLRRQQDTVADFSRNVAQQERDYTNRLIEIYGLPYDDDVGTGKTYPLGYEGPDLYHYMYVDRTELTGESPSGSRVVAIEIPDVTLLETDAGTWLDELVANFAETGELTYDVSLDGTGFVKPESWTSRRRAPGELQVLLSDLYRNRARYESAVLEYGELIDEIADNAELLEARYNLNTTEIDLLADNLEWQGRFSGWIEDYKTNLYRYEREADRLRAEGAMITEALSCAGQVLQGWDADDGIAGWIFNIIGLIVCGSTVWPGLDYENQAQSELSSAEWEVGNIAFQEWRKERDLYQLEIDLETASNEFEVKQAVAELKQLVRREPAAAVELHILKEAIQQSIGLYRSKLAEGQRLLEELIAYRKDAAADTQSHRYRDMAFRVFRNDAIQKYRAQFDMAARYAYLAATAYDYETNLLGDSPAAGSNFLTDIVKQRSLGQVLNGEPVAGSGGLAEPLAMMELNFAVLRGQLGFNNPQNESNTFSLRWEFLGIDPDSGFDADWRTELGNYRVADLWDVPEFRRYARPFAEEQPEPGIVIGLTPGGTQMSTSIIAGKNFFGLELRGGDSAYDPSLFATRVRAVGVGFEGYDSTNLSATPRVYLIPVGMDVLRTPDADDFTTRLWRVIDQKIPVPYPITDADLTDPGWIPMQDALAEDLAGIRRLSSFRAYDWSGGFSPGEATSDTRLVGRSVWNNKWLLIIPGRALGSDPSAALDDFIAGSTDIKLYFRTYGYSGN